MQAEWLQTIESDRKGCCTEPVSTIYGRRSEEHGFSPTNSFFPSTLTIYKFLDKNLARTKTFPFSNHVSIQGWQAHAKK